MEALRAPRLLGLILFAVILWVSPEEATSCDVDTARSGMMYCRMALDRTLRDKVEKNTREKSCCVAYNFRDCIQHSLSSGRCFSKNEAIDRMVDDQVEQAQIDINKGDRFIGNFICEQQSKSQCRFLSYEFDKAKKNMPLMNAATSNMMVIPFLALMCSFFAIVCSRLE